MQVSKILAIKGTVLYTVVPEQRLDMAVSVMSEQDVGSLVCVSGGQVVGMLTFREVLKAMNANGSQWGAVQVSEVMLQNPVTARPDMDIDQLRQMMVRDHQRYLPVMDGTTLMGVVSFHDVAKAVLEEQGFENRMLKAYIRDWPDESGEDRVSA